MARRPSAVAPSTSSRARPASVVTAALSRSVVQPPSARRYTTAPSPTRLAVTTTGPVILIFLCSSGDVIEASRAGAELEKIASQNPAMGNVLLYMVQFHAANSRMFCQTERVWQQNPPGRRGEAEIIQSCRAAAVIRPRTRLTIHAITA